MNQSTDRRRKVAWNTLGISILLVFAVATPAQPADIDAVRSELRKACADEGYKLTPKLREAYLAYARAQARADLEALGKTLPKDFWAWLAEHPEVETSVYVAHEKPSEVLQHLYALSLDLGTARFEKYDQLALAAAIVSAKQAAEADITPREPLEVVIGGDPRKPVDTKDADRELDKNDHIINFLNDNTIEEEVVTGYKETDGELKYDDRGIAIPAPKGKKKKVAIVEKRKRSLYACDVLASAKLQKDFNDYMKSKGHPVEIDCGERVVHWDSRDAVHGEQRKKIGEAYRLFREAYEAKGLLPSARDPIPSIAERCVYIIRNYEHEFPDEVERAWPQFPITAPWPVLTLLVDDDQPLREREERWEAFRDRGEFKKYGEYIGAIAQQFDMQSARRLKPHPYTYHTIQMMLKDGGVCGTMGSISARSHISLGIPACQAIQPGHCAMAFFHYDAKKKLYACKGGQYATGGDEKTTPFARWYFGDRAKKYERRPGFGVQPNPRKPMVYHQSVAWAVNHGMPSLLDSTMAWCIYQLLDESEQEAGGEELLGNAIAVNPYNFLIADTAQAAADTPAEQIAFWRTFQAAVELFGDQSGCRPDGLYSKTVKSKVFASIAKLPVPEDKATAEKVYAFLQSEGCDAPAALVRYRLAVEGLPALLAQTDADFQKHLESTRAVASEKNDTACAHMATSLKTTATCIEDKEARTEWASKLLKHAKGREKYFGRWMRVATDPSVAFLSKQAGRRMPNDTDLMQSLLDRLAAELKDSVEGQRDLKACRQLADRIKAAAKHTKDADQKEKWSRHLSKIITGNETFQPVSKRKTAKALRDPCAEAIDGLLKAT